jgi:hypothetical protein
MNGTSLGAGYVAADDWHSREQTAKLIALEVRLPVLYDDPDGGAAAISR